MSNKNNIFILSTGRTGTKFFADILNEKKGIYAVHEPKPSRRLRFWTIQYLQGGVSEKKMENIFLRFRGKLLTNREEEFYVESNNFLSGFTSAIYSILDDPLIIHIVRDPRDFVRSLINHGNDEGIKGFANNFLPNAFISKDNIKCSVDLTNREDYLIARAATYWKLVNENIEGSSRGQTNYRIFKFEDLFYGDNETLRSALKLMGLKKPTGKDLKLKSKKSNKSRLNVLQRWDSWTDRQATIVDDICRDYMSKFGYGTEASWMDKIKDFQNE